MASIIKCPSCKGRFKKSENYKKVAIRDTEGSGIQSYSRIYVCPYCSHSMGAHPASGKRRGLPYKRQRG
jgi:hypothetical protein